MLKYKVIDRLNHLKVMRGSEFNNQNIIFSIHEKNEINLFTQHLLNNFELHKSTESSLKKLQPVLKSSSAGRNAQIFISYKNLIFYMGDELKKKNRFF
ncbi:hypothetical protein [Erwinia amylovora]|uniref:hypothetical protein n=1 Tax=Erwinia amylovora TaxID=552 RepID=UPI00144464F9|nr:hypothetical protein [Erwinia amylovora]